MNPSNLLSRSHRALLDRAGVPRIRFHDLRPTAATLMLGRLPTAYGARAIGLVRHFLANLAVDVLYGVIDPRVRTS